MLTVNTLPKHWDAMYYSDVCFMLLTTPMNQLRKKTSVLI